MNISIASVKKMPVKITDEDHMINVCKFNNLACCRYLMFAEEAFRCGKTDVLMKAQMDQRVALKQKAAIGDNCPGFGVKEAQ